MITKSIVSISIFQELICINAYGVMRIWMRILVLKEFRMNRWSWNSYSIGYGSDLAKMPFKSTFDENYLVMHRIRTTTRTFPKKHILILLAENFFPDDCANRNSFEILHKEKRFRILITNHHSSNTSNRELWHQFVEVKFNVVGYILERI
jgi:hypothetical protein